MIARLFATTLAGFAMAGAGVSPAAAQWQDVDISETLVGLNPCTGQDTLITLQVEQAHLTGGKSGNVGFHFRGTYSAVDGSYGRFRDTDQDNQVANGDGFNFTQRVQYIGWYDGRRQQSHYVLHVVEIDGQLRVLFDQQSAHCSGR